MWEEAGGPSKVLGQQIVNTIINHLMIQGCELGLVIIWIVELTFIAIMLPTKVFCDVPPHFVSQRTKTSRRAWIFCVSLLVFYNSVNRVGAWQDYYYQQHMMNQNKKGKESKTQKHKNVRDNKEHNKEHHHQEQDDNKYNAVTCNY